MQWARGYVADVGGGSSRARQGGCHEGGALGPDPVAAARGFCLGPFWDVLGSPPPPLSRLLPVVSLRGVVGGSSGIRTRATGSANLFQ